jgi:hypothetical protein
MQVLHQSILFYTGRHGRPFLSENHRIDQFLNDKMLLL